MLNNFSLYDLYIKKLLIIKKPLVFILLDRLLGASLYTNSDVII